MSTAGRWTEVSQVRGLKETERLENRERKRSTPTACSTAQTPSTWTEPPSLSAVRCDPRSSLLVTGVGWDSLPLGSGDWHDSNGGRGVGGWQRA